MYAIHHRRNFNTRKDYAVIGGRYRTLKEAREARFVSGDLVVCLFSHEVIPSNEWLWDWEKGNPHNYANMAIADSKYGR